MDCPKCGFVLGPLDTDCPRCKAGYVPPARMPAPAPAVPIVTEALRFCPRCQQEIPPDYENCPRCVDTTPLLRPMTQQRGRRWQPLDIALAVAMVASVFIDIASESYASIFGLILFLATLAIYGLVLMDIWQDENSFGTYAYILTAWLLFWSIVGVILIPVSIFSYMVAGVQLIILAGLWKRYGSPLGR